MYEGKIKSERRTQELLNINNRNNNRERRSRKCKKGEQTKRG